MGLVELKCKSCGATLTVSDEGEYFYCEYCDTRLTHETIYHEVSGTVKIDGIAGVDELLERAVILLSSCDYSQAAEMYSRVLEVSPRCAEAYWGMMLCEYSENDADYFVQAAVDITANRNYELAVKFSEGEEKAYYMSIGEKAKANSDARFALDEAARKKYISNNKMLKRISRLVLYISFSAFVLIAVWFFRISAMLEAVDSSNTEALERLFSYENASIFGMTLSSLVALISNKLVVYAKGKLGDYPLNWFRFILLAIFIFCAFAFFVTFIF